MLGRVLAVSQHDPPLTPFGPYKLIAPLPGRGAAQFLFQPLCWFLGTATPSEDRGAQQADAKQGDRCRLRHAVDATRGTSACVAVVGGVRAGLGGGKFFACFPGHVVVHVQRKEHAAAPPRRSC